MTDELSILLGSSLLQLILIGAVIVAMKLVLVGQFALAGGLVLPLFVAGYLIATDGAFLA